MLRISLVSGKILSRIRVFTKIISRLETCENDPCEVSSFHIILHGLKPLFNSLLQRDFISRSCSVFLFCKICQWAGKISLVDKTDTQLIVQSVVQIRLLESSWNYIRFHTLINMVHIWICTRSLV